MSSSPPCPHLDRCPGCPRFGETAIDPTRLQTLQSLAARFGLPGELREVEFPGPGFRRRVRLSLREVGGIIRAGIFEAGSHRLVGIEDCPIHHPRIEAGIQAVVDGANRHALVAYDERVHTGLLRALQFAVSPLDDSLQCVLSLRDALEGRSSLEALGPFLQELQESGVIRSLFLGALPEKTNSLFPKKLYKCFGEDAYRDECGGASIFYPPDAFGQANPPLHAEAVKQIHSWVDAQRSVVEYYCGVGSIGLGLVGSHDVVFNELGSGSLAGLRRGLEESEQGIGSHRILEGKAGDHAQAYNTESSVIVDPPRKGLDPTLLRRLSDEPPAQLIYLSCGLDAFERETESLVAGGMSLKRLEAYSYFPFTKHVETLALFERE